MTGHTFIVVGISKSVFPGASPAAYASFPLFHNQISVHIAPKAAKWKKEQAQSMRLWMYDCFSCVLRNVVSLARTPSRSRWWMSRHASAVSFSAVSELTLAAARPNDKAKRVSYPLGGVFLRRRRWESPRLGSDSLTASWSGCWCETRDGDQGLISGEFVVGFFF